MDKLTRPLETFFPYRLAVAAEGFSRNLANVYGRGYGLSREEWRLLFLLAGEAEVTSRDLSRRSTLDRVQVSRASQKLEDKGLITRNIAPNDRRLKVYACTKRGRALFADALPQVEARSNEILRAMSPEDRAALERGLAALSEAIATCAAPPEFERGPRS
ncbi:HTH-type transcriptional regulator MhqR [Antarctobacter heliothermus]|uniref:HTH-type transcriptional regulator MhqR n=1 Tax=Antarctobacter heliothermus TaxID=74033 RepID=A0A222E4E1_9RHOB|nr:MarR family transcriptional regulator [Antarctobacter heliothermus]ASP21067.1 HTH-type transcriptional regulator MhqR [Antarctobacter heliothermus]